MVLVPWVVCSCQKSVWKRLTPRGRESWSSRPGLSCSWSSGRGGSVQRGQLAKQCMTPSSASGALRCGGAGGKGRQSASARWRHCALTREPANAWLSSCSTVRITASGLFWEEIWSRDCLFECSPLSPVRYLWRRVEWRYETPVLRKLRGKVQTCLPKWVVNEL